MQKQVVTNAMIACPDCDALLTTPELAPGESAKCPRCHSTLIEKRVNTMDRTLAVAIAGVLFFFPAMFLPLIGLETFGFSNQTSIYGSIVIMWQEGRYFVSIAVLLFIALFPILRLVMIAYLLYRLKKKQFSPHFLPLYRWFFHFRDWEMLEVFLLGVIVSLYKLLSLADVVYGIGLFAFVMLMLCSILIVRFKDSHYVWQLIEEYTSENR